MRLLILLGVLANAWGVLMILNPHFSHSQCSRLFVKRMVAMPKITFIGAGSTVFAKNLLGDILSFPELADSTISLFDIDAGAAAHLGDRGAQGRAGRWAPTRRSRRRPTAARARRRRLRHLHDPGRRLQARHGDGLRDPQEVRPAPDDRRHARHRRHHARPAHDPGAARHVPRHGGALPGRDLPAVCQSDGDELLGDQPRQHDQDGRAVPQRAGHGRAAGARHRRADRGDQLCLRRHQPHGLLPEASSATAKICTR